MPAAIGIKSGENKPRNVGGVVENKVARLLWPTG